MYNIGGQYGVSIDTLVTKYKEGRATWQDTIDIAQYILDTETIGTYPEFRQLCDYYIAEGLCYYVPV